MPFQGSAEDKDDVFIENLNTALFLLLGILAVAASVILFGYSVVIAVLSLGFSMSVITSTVFSAVLLIPGLGSLHLFRKRRRERKEKTGSLFYRAR